MADDFNWQTGEQEESQLPDIPLAGGYADGKSGEDIDREALQKQIPPGDQVLFVKHVECPINEYTREPEEKKVDVWLDDHPAFYYTYPLTVTAGWVEDPDCTIKIFLKPPPVRADELDAYARGGKMPAEGSHDSSYRPSKQSCGFAWRHFKSFVHHLGFDMNPDGTLPREAQISNWRRWPDGKLRLFKARIVAGQPPPDDPKNTQGKRLFNQLDIFPFSDSEDTILRCQRQRNGQQQQQQRPPSTVSPAQQVANAQRGQGQGQGQPQGQQAQSPARPQTQVPPKAAPAHHAPQSAAARVAAGEVDI